MKIRFSFDGYFRMTVVVVMLLLVSYCVRAQGPANGLSPAANVIGGQMLNMSNTYPNCNNDTVTNAGTLYLAMGRYNKTTALPELYTPGGTGSISFGVTGTKISGTPGGTVTLEESFNGVGWYPVRTYSIPIVASYTDGSATWTNTFTYPDVFTVTNVTSQAFSWNLAHNSAPYYRLKLGITGTQVSSWKAFWVLTKG